jgi:hypothetical protein
MIRDVTIPAKECTCEKCGHRWTHFGPRPPTNCPRKTCRTREWNGRKPQPSKIKLPAPRKKGRPKATTVFDYSEDP